MPTSPPLEVDVEGRRLTLTNLDKVLYSGSGHTKADVIDYYRRIAPFLLPHLEGRVPTLVRAPDGDTGEIFFEKRYPRHKPDWIPTAVVGRYANHKGYTGCVIDTLPALVWVANLAALELHTHQHRYAQPEVPTAVVIDLDPGSPATTRDCARVALDIRGLLDRLGLLAVAKSSGGKGIHLSIPINVAPESPAPESPAPESPAPENQIDAEATKRFALAIGQYLEAQDPKRVTTNMAKTERPGRVFVDWSQNDRNKTTACAYSLRIGPHARVSTPLSWEEVEAIASGVLDPRWTPSDVIERAEKLGDLYAPNLQLHQVLPKL